MGIIDDVVGEVEHVVEEVVEVAEEAVEFVVEGAGKVIHEVVDGIETAVHEVEKFAETVVVDVVHVVEEVVEDVVEEVVQVEKGVEHLVEGVIHEIEEVVHDVEQLGENVIHEIGDVVHDVESFAETVFHAIVAAAGKLLNMVEGLVIAGIVTRVGGDPDVVIKEGLHLPTVDKFTVSLAGLTLEEVKVAATLSLTNPNAIPLPLVEISASVVVGGRTVASFDADAATIPARGSGNVNLTLALHYLELIKDAAYDVLTGIVKFTVKVELTLQIPNGERHVLPYEWDVTLPLPILPFLALAKVGFKSSSTDESSDVALYLSLHNPNVFDMDLNSLRCEVSLGGVLVGSVELPKPAGKIRKQKMGVVKIAFSFKPKKFGNDFCQKLNGRSIGYSLQGTIDVQTPYGPMKMPIIMKDKAGTYTPLVNEPSA
ncbi:uncharacterized protein M6B38_274545 [Iris pallida]|uniref:Water stress and hypersensitive response domain-containing protein n=1 Tax=Iris pallida TaxID=29817 RepID=A0AAX6I6V3_IRIPA|nr:uncharacterized protein M6B38_274545 [Iris pallida]